MSGDDRAFGEWLAAQLEVRRMSLRGLAETSGVSHSTISRLVRGSRAPSLDVATRLARGLGGVPPALAPPRRGAVADVQGALWADESLTTAQVRQVMDYYLAVRAGRVPARERRATPVVGAVRRA